MSSSKSDESPNPIQTQTADAFVLLWLSMMEHPSLETEHVAEFAPPPQPGLNPRVWV